MTKVRLDAEAPDFELPDAAGGPFRLSELRGRKNVVLVFNRGFT